MVSRLPEGFEEFKEKILDEVFKKTSQELHDVAHGALSPDNILRGQVKIEGNGYIDEVLQKLNEKLESNQTHNVTLPNHTFRFQKSLMCGIPVPGQVELLDGNINGLSAIYRVHNAELNINVFNDPILTAIAELGFRVSEVSSSANITLGACLAANDVQIRGELKNISMTIQVSVNREFTTHLDKYDVNHTGDLTIGFENLGKFDYLAETIKDDIGKTIQQTITEYIQNTVRSMADEIVRKLSFHM